jgi:hypothetical protein
MSGLITGINGGAVAGGIREGGGTQLTVATVADGEVLYRSGTTVDGVANTALVAGALKSATTSVSVSAATAPSSGQVLTATGASTATWQAVSGGGVTTYAYHDTRPSALGAASDHDIEFATEEPTDSGYAYNTAPSGTPDFLTLNSSGNPKASWEGATREGHGAVQPIDATAFIADKTITVDTDCWLHFRCPIATVNGTPDATNYTTARLALDDGAGTNRIELWFGHAYTATSGVNAASAIAVQTTASTPASVGSLSWSAHSPVEEAFIIKDSTVYYFYVRVGTTWRYLGTHTHATTMTRIRLWFLTDGAMLPGGGILYPKFFRYGSSLPTALP